MTTSSVLNDKLHCCYCGFEKEASKEMYFYCGHDIMSEIKKSVAASKPTKLCLKYVLIGNHEINVLFEKVYCEVNLVWIE